MGEEAYDRRGEKTREEKKKKVSAIKKKKNSPLKSKGPDEAETRIQARKDGKSKRKTQPKVEGRIERGKRSARP